MTLITAMGMPVRGLLRQKGTPYDELDLGNPTWTADELIDLQHSVDPAYRNGDAKFMLSDTALKGVRKLKDSQNQYLWQPSLQVGVPDVLLGKPVYTDSNVAAQGSNGRVPVIVRFTGLTAADAGKTIIATAAGMMISTPGGGGGTVGSVGVFALHIDESKALEAEGYKVTCISAGKFKTEFAHQQPPQQQLEL